MVKTIIIIFIFNCCFNLYAEDLIPKKNHPNDKQKTPTLNEDSKKKEEKKKKPSNKIIQMDLNEKKFNIALAYYNYEYEIPKKMREYGKMYGLNFSYETWLNHYQGWVSFSIEYTLGKITYDGNYQDGTPAIVKTDEKILNLRGLAGLSLTETETYSLICFTGLGKRSLKDKIKERFVILIFRWVLVFIIRSQIK